MAGYSIIANRGDNENKFTIQSGAPGTLAADQMCLYVDRTTSLTRGDVEMFIEKLERLIPKTNFPFV